MTQPSAPALRPFDGSSIPQALKDLDRWTIWKAVWNVKRGKYDKIPCRADMPAFGISTAKPERWYSYAQASAALQANPGFAGLGLVLTGLTGFVGIDLDNCIVNGVIEPWAQAVLDSANTYSEFSPSGNGLRAFALGDQAIDWNNHTQGIEVYGGKDARFLTVSGDHVPDTPLDVRATPPDVLASLEGQYATTRTRATVIDLQMPDILPEADLPTLSLLDLPAPVMQFLDAGHYEHDGSGILHASGIALYAAGLTDAQVYSTLAQNSHAMDVALRHRNQDSDRALMYIWREQCLKTKPKAASRVASPDDFDDVSDAPGVPLTGPTTSATPDASLQRPKRFAFIQAGEYIKRKPTSWLIKKVLPRADVGAVFGVSGAGKSYFVLDLVAAIATGTPWMGRTVKQGTVGYVCAEGAGGFIHRLEAYAEHYFTECSRVPIHILPESPNFLEKADIRDLVARIKELGPVSVVVVDTLAQVTAGANENSGEDMGKALANCKALAQATGAMVLLVAHSGKDAGRGLRGWSGIKGALDVEIMVESVDNVRSATITKMKDGEGEGTEFPFSLQSVVLRQDEEGEDITSCVIKSGTTTPQRQRTAAPKGVWQQAVCRVVVTLTDLAGAPTAAQLITAVLAEMPAADGPRDQRRTLATRALDALVASGRLQMAGGTVVVGA